ncbi:MAG: c-type cytochrome [Pseudohongiellaceae bacterium]
MSIVKRVKPNRISTLGFCLVAAVFAGNAGADSKSSGEPMMLAALSEGFNAEQTYMQSCGACHNSGAAGAPKLDDAADWESRMEKGMEAVVANAINGLNGVMPPKGLCFSCTDDDLRAVVEYMVEQVPAD